MGTLLVLTLAAWVIGRAFSGDVRDGILSLGLASTEIASVGLIGLAGADAVLALGVLTASLICAAIFGPLLATVLAHTSGHASGLSLLVRFALGSLAFMIVAGALAVSLVRVARTLNPPAVALTTGLRDFAVAAALATQAFGSSAAGVAGVYGAFMLLAGAIIATLLRHRASTSRRALP